MVGVTVSVVVSVSVTVSVRNFVVVTVLNSVVTLVVLTVILTKDVVDGVPHFASVLLGAARCELPVRAPVADADAALPLDFAVQAVLDGLVPGLGLVPVPRPVTVGWLDGEVNRGVLEAEPGVGPAAGVLDAIAVEGVEDPVEEVEEVEDTADEEVEEVEEVEEEVADVEEGEEPVEAEVGVEEPVEPAPPTSPAAKSFGPGIS